ncbi:MAG: hypothetical protein WDN46_03865 [Methylocella sp.]
MDNARYCIDELDTESPYPARDRLREAQTALKTANASLEAAEAALGRGKERLALLSEERAAALEEETAEARARAVHFEHGVAAVILTGSSRRRRDLDDQFQSLEATIAHLAVKLDEAQRKRADAECELKRAVQAAIDEEASPLLSRMLDCELAAASLRTELRALAYSWGIAPSGLADKLARRPANYIDNAHPLSAATQNRSEKCKVAWAAFAARLRDDAGARLDLP